MKSALHLVPKNAYWCCGADFGQHEPTCPNYKIAPFTSVSGAIEADSPVRAGKDESAFLEEFLAVDCLAKARNHLAAQFDNSWDYHRVTANLQARMILNDCLSRLVDRIQEESEGA